MLRVAATATIPKIDQILGTSSPKEGTIRKIGILGIVTEAERSSYMKTNCFRYQMITRYQNGTVGVNYIEAPCRSFAEGEFQERFPNCIIVESRIVGMYGDSGDYTEV